MQIYNVHNIANIDILCDALNMLKPHIGLKEEDKTVA